MQDQALGGPEHGHEATRSGVGHGQKLTVERSDGAPVMVLEGHQVGYRDPGGLQLSPDHPQGEWGPVDRERQLT